MTNNQKAKELLENLIKQDYKFKDENGNDISVPASGNLGLLAVGYKGIIAVRKKRNQKRKNKN